jgi:hypothetical protein
MPRRATQATTRVVAVALACLSLLGNVAGFAHLVLVQHVSCEHGELVHLGPARSALAPQVGRDGDRTAIDAAGATEAHGHDHCLLAPTRREQLGVRREPASPTLAPRPLAVGAFADATATPPPIPILVLAPKNSPPHV